MSSFLLYSYSTDKERLKLRHLILENLLETLESAFSRMKLKEIKFEQHDETVKVCGNIRTELPRNFVHALISFQKYDQQIDFSLQIYFHIFICALSFQTNYA